MTELKRMVIWEDERHDDMGDLGGHLIDPEEIEEKVYLNTVVFLLRGLADTKENREKLEAILNRRVLKPEQYEDEEVREYLDIEIKKLFGKTYGADTAGEYETYRDMLIYCVDTNIDTTSIGNLQDWDEDPVYTYWDGSNWRDIWYHEEYMTQTEVTYNPREAEILDTWDGNNWSFQGKFNHGKLVPLVEVDGREVDGKHLLIQCTDYQGNIPTARIIEATEAEELLKHPEEI